MRLSRTATFWLLAVILVMFLFAASAPSPLYAVYQARWHFSTATLTVVYAVYVATLLAALVWAGSASDHLGRRPVLAVALVIESVAMLAFAMAGGTTTLFVARILQGLGTGIATGAIGAMLFDVQPPDRPGSGALAGSVAPAVGLAVGGLGSSLVTTFAPPHAPLVFWALAAFFIVVLGAVPAMPETVSQRTRWHPGIRPRVSVPPALTATFAKLAPCIVAFWALSGLYLSLGPSIVRTVLHEQSGLAGGLVIFTLSATGAAGSVATRSWSPRRAVISGSGTLVAGVVLTLIAVSRTDSTLFYLGTATVGVGFGPAFTGVFRLLTAEVGSEQRASVVGAIYVAAYLALGVPAVLAGIAVPWIGLATVFDIYASAVLVLAVTTVVAFVAGSTGRSWRAGTVAPGPCPCPGTVAVHHGTG
ncbi:MFS transporter [Dactylosporangium fulvum]|uniref:MFS transporter n=1 Tax=Dactylosporangium fulvum TaxID=53359 RepID=A0ABY5VZ07_9ACTN|nr:MFS transporter [Dactylosporangium fulvum]UWP82425.1 MFS transporter [Dactylosporangium fulvum]